MRRTKPDRWERLTAKYSYIDVGHGDQPDDYAVDASMVAKLLRREHRAVVRLLNKQLKECKAANRRTVLCGERTMAYGWQCRADQCQDILDRLIARAR